MPNFNIKLICFQIVRGLLYIHSRGICDRDIKFMIQLDMKIENNHFFEFEAYKGKLAIAEGI